jgi:hypothetical protein
VQTVDRVAVETEPTVAVAVVAAASVAVSSLSQPQRSTGVVQLLPVLSPSKVETVATVAQTRSATQAAVVVALVVPVALFISSTERLPAQPQQDFSVSPPGQAE